MFDHQDKVVVVTGAGCGIGAGTALEFAKCGSKLALIDKDEKSLKENADICNNAGAKEVLEIVADLSDHKQLEAIVNKIVDRFGKISILCNIAGVMLKDSLEEAKPETFDFLFAINMKSMMYLTQAAMPHLIKTKGNVINISSVNSYLHFPASLTYSLTKSAVDQFTKTVAKGYAKHGVRVNAINPGDIRTRLRNSFWTDDFITKYYEDCKSTIPLGQVGEASDVANAILFLTSHMARLITGECLTIAGGENLL